MQELNKSYKIVRSKEDVLELMKHIEASDVIAYDTETDSLNMRKGSIVGWSVSGDPLQSQAPVLPACQHRGRPTMDR